MDFFVRDLQPALAADPPVDHLVAKSFKATQRTTPQEVISVAAAARLFVAAAAAAAAALVLVAVPAAAHGYYSASLPKKGGDT